MNYKKIIKSIKKKESVRGLIYKLINLPIVGYFYKSFYSKKVNKKVNDFKISDLYVSIEPSNICNSRCLMCPYKTMTRPKTTMSMDLFKKIIDDCFKNGIKNLNLNFYNEPFLDAQIFERIAYAKSKGFNVGTFSNGSVITQEIREKILKSGLDEIIFSFDGFSKQTYEKIRQGLNFEIVRDNILSLTEQRNSKSLSKPKISVMFVQSQWNKHEALDFKNYWQDKVDHVGFSTDDNRAGNLGKQLGKSVFPCRKLWSEIIVMSNGKVALCCLDYDGQVILGDFNNQNLKQIWEGEKFKAIRQLHLDFKSDKIELCKNCLNSYRFNARSWLN